MNLNEDVWEFEKFNEDITLVIRNIIKIMMAS